MILIEKFNDKFPDFYNLVFKFLHLWNVNVFIWISSYRWTIGIGAPFKYNVYFLEIRNIVLGDNKG